MSHTYDTEDGLPNLEAGPKWYDDDNASDSSVVHKSLVASPSNFQVPRLFSEKVIVICRARMNSRLMSARTSRHCLIKPKMLP